jgi:hypothetical protein
MTRFAAVLAGCAFAAVTGPASRESPPRSASVFASFETEGRSGSHLAEPARDGLSVSLDGRPAEILRVSPVTGRASVLLLADLTWSTTRGHHPGHDPEVEHLKRAIAKLGRQWTPFPGSILGMDKAFLPLLGPRDDLRVGSFGGQRLAFSRAASADAAARLAAFREVISPDVVPLGDWVGPSRIWDAVAAASKHLSSDASFRSIVLVTDGQSSGNRIGHADAIEAALLHGVAVHVVCQKTWWDPSMAPAADTFVGRLAEQTGGLLRIDDAASERLATPWDKPARVFRDIVDAIHNSYEIQLDAADVGEGTHRLEIRTRAPGTRVHAPAWLTIGVQAGDV